MTTLSTHGLWCPNCEKPAVAITFSIWSRMREGKSRVGLAQCTQCGYSIDDLGKGTLQSALEEWEAACQSARMVKQQLLGEQAMKNEQLELDVTAFLGVTDWIDAAEHPPEHSGWYDVRYKMSEEEREQRGYLLQRRWWDSSKQQFGWPVEVGSDPTAEDIERCISRMATAPTGRFEYRGLKSQHPDLMFRRR